MQLEYRTKAKELAQLLPSGIDGCKPFEVVNQHGKLLHFSLEFVEDYTPLGEGIVLYSNDYNTEGDTTFDDEYKQFLVEPGFITAFKVDCGIAGGFKSFILNADERNHHNETAYNEVDLERILAVLNADTNSYGLGDY